MARKEAVIKEIAGRNYTFGILGPFKAHRLLVKLIKLVGPAMSGIDMDGVESIKDANIDIEKIVTGLTTALDENETEQIILTLGEQIICEGKTLNQANIDALFTGDILSLYKVVAAALEVQFGDFFGEGGVFAGAKDLLEESLNPAK